MKRMKRHPHGSVVFCTSSIEEGLLLLSNPLCEALIKSCLAQAAAKHPVRISHVLVKATQLNVLLVVDNLDDVQGVHALGGERGDSEKSRNSVLPSRAPEHHRDRETSMGSQAAFNELWS